MGILYGQVRAIADSERSMTWVKVDDGFADHPKVFKIGDTAFRLHICAMCITARQRTNGEIQPSSLACAIAMLPNPPDDPMDLVHELIDVGLWTSIGNSAYLIIGDDSLWRIDIRLNRKRPYLRHRGFVYARDGRLCRYCSGSDHLSLDHLQPPRLGGTHDPDNLVTCCRPCNSRKGSRTPEQAGMQLLPMGGV